MPPSWALRQPHRLRARPPPITEAGSSLVYPLVYKWSTVYTTTKVSPAAGGSSAGISDISASSPSVNIGASDAPMTSSQYSSDSHNAVEIPWALSATDVVYNIPGLHAGLKLSATIVAEIYTGRSPGGAARRSSS